MALMAAAAPWTLAQADTSPLQLYSVSDGSDNFVRIAPLDDPDITAVESLSHSEKFGSNITPVSYGKRFYFLSASQGGNQENFFTITDTGLNTISQVSLGLDNTGHHVLPLSGSSGYISTFRALYRYNLDEDAALINLTEVAQGAFGHIVAIGGKLYVPYCESPSSSFNSADRRAIKVISIADESEITTIDLSDKIDTSHAISSMVLGKDGNIYIAAQGCTYADYSNPAWNRIFRLNPATFAVEQIDLNGISSPVQNLMGWCIGTFIASTTRPALYWVGTSAQGWNVNYHINEYDLTTGTCSQLIEQWPGESQGCPTYKGAFVEDPTNGILYQAAGGYSSAKLYACDPTDTEEAIIFPQIRNISGGSIALFFNNIIAPESVTLSASDCSLAVGETLSITASLSGNPTVTGLVWTSSDPSVATVSPDGVVTAVKTGYATVTASSLANTEINASCTVTVKRPQVNFTPSLVVTVDENGLMFYDDGGPDKKNDPVAIGTASMTFIPADPSQKVQIDFLSVNRYFEDIFKIYNGREVNEDNLIERLYNNPAVVRSSADDGSLTVYWRNVTSDEVYARDGWEAIVSTFTPAAMQIENVSLSQGKVPSVAACETNRNVMLIDFETSGNADALTLESITFDLGENWQYASKVSLLATKRTTAVEYAPSLCGKDDVPPAVAVGEATVSGSTVTIPLKENFRLNELTNYYHLLMDMTDKCRNSTTMQIKLVSAAVSGNSFIPEPGVSYNLPVENIITMARGEADYTIYGQDWAVRNLPADEAAGEMGYESDVRNWHTVRLHPSVEGKKVELHIKKYNFFMSDPSGRFYREENESQFFIFDGADTQAPELLRLSYDNNGKEVDEVYRSTAPDGSITVHFWHGMLGYYHNDPQRASEYGFTAIASEVDPKPMTVTCAEISQPDSSPVTSAPTGRNERVIDIRLKTDGSLSPQQLNSITVDLKGNEANFTALRVANAALDFHFTDPEIISELSVTPDKGQYTFQFNGVTLADGRNCLRIYADMADDLPALSSADLMVTEVKCNNTPVELVNPDPDGGRYVSCHYNFLSGQNEVLIGTQTILFYDNGGSADNYDLTSGTVTFRPRHEGKRIRVQVNERPDLSAGDNLYIYSGSEVNSDNQLTVLKYNTKQSLFPMTLDSENPDGAVTFSFNPTSDDAKYGNLAGWFIEISAVDAPGSSISPVFDNAGIPVDIYNLHGQLLHSQVILSQVRQMLPAGIYIVRNATSTMKIHIR